MEMLGRRALWEVGLNYGHGTGHGVGNYFGVHECKIFAFFNRLTLMDEKFCFFFNIYDFWALGTEMSERAFINVGCGNILNVIIY